MLCECAECDDRDQSLEPDSALQLPRLNLCNASFDVAHVDAYCMGTGVIPIARSPDGQVRLLLGRERWITQWKGSCRWSGFEGGRKHGEGVVAAAVREFHEESLDVVADPATVHERLTESDFWLRVVTSTALDHAKGTEVGAAPRRYHCTYVLPVPWDESLPARFRTIRSRIEQLDSLAQEWRHVRPDDWPVGATVGPIDARVATSDAPDEATVVFADNAPVLLRGPEAQRAAQWSAVRDRIERVLVQHPSVSVTRDPQWSLLQGLCVKRDYLEKDQVRWWSLSDLTRVLRGRGQSDGERFRPFFLPVLQTVVAQVQTALREEGDLPQQRPSLRPRSSP
jgi:hypothetical protein